MGEQVTVETVGDQNPSVALFGSLCFPSGERLHTIHQRKHHHKVEAHLQLLIEMHPDTFLLGSHHLFLSYFLGKEQSVY